MSALRRDNPIRTGIAMQAESAEHPHPASLPAIRRAVPLLATLALLAAAGLVGLAWIEAPLLPELPLLPALLLGGNATLLLVALLQLVGGRFRSSALALLLVGCLPVLGLLLAQLPMPLPPAMASLRWLWLTATAAAWMAPVGALALLFGRGVPRLWGSLALLLLATASSLATIDCWWPRRELIPDLSLVTGVFLAGWALHLLTALLWLPAAAPRRQPKPAAGFSAPHISEGEASELRFAHAFNRAAVGIAMTDAGGGWLWANARLCEISGYPLEQLRTLDVLALTHPEDREAEAERRRRLLAGEIDDYAMEQRQVARSGAVIWVNLFVRRLDAGPMAPLRVILVVEDISERHHNEARLLALTSNLERQVSERTSQLHLSMRNWKQRNIELTLLARMGAALQAAETLTAASHLIARYLPEIFGEYGGALYLRMAATEPLSLQCQWGGYSAAQQQLAEDDCWALQLRCEHRIEDPADPLPCAHLIAHRDHHSGDRPSLLEHHSCMPIIAEGVLLGMIYLQWPGVAGGEIAAPDKLLLATTAEQVGLAIRNLDLRDLLQRQAIRDPLTGLYNRRFLDDYLQRRMAESQRSGRGLSVLVFDLDHFKHFNDRLGHDCGDHVLCAFAAMLQKRVRADEAAFRVGGEEFVVVLNSDRLDDVRGCGERVRSGTETLQLGFRGQPLPTLTVSGGAASYPAQGDSISALIRAADQALYRAKHSGRNCIVISESPDDSTSHPPTTAASGPEANARRVEQLTDALAAQLEREDS